MNASARPPVSETKIWNIVAMITPDVKGNKYFMVRINSVSSRQHAPNSSFRICYGTILLLCCYCRGHRAPRMQLNGGKRFKK
mmetsp:Transcript_27029/g.55561  ORF Transcript_27029/g.55561 Transcript_27029/m.55561 type:complete len:82 (-) Transcript_27029:89-334(-)